jgi:tRNA(Arg) A34 adenosine deaminase TadA
MAAQNVKNGGGPFGAVIVKDGKIIGRGINRVTETNDPTAHAEVTAIRDACKNLDEFRLDGAVIYTSCEPCPMCLGAIYWARIEKIVFAADKNDAAKAGFDDSFIYDEFALPHEKRAIPLKRLTLNNANLPFETWIKHEGKTNY